MHLENIPREWRVKLNLGIFFYLTLSSCYILDKSINTTTYINEILHPFYNTFTSRSLREKELTLEEDNATTHTSKKTQQWFQEEKIKLLEWPQQSPDMNLKKHLWDRLQIMINERPSLQDIVRAKVRICGRVVQNPCGRTGKVGIGNFKKIARNKKMRGLNTHY